MVPRLNKRGGWNRPRKRRKIVEFLKYNSDAIQITLSAITVGLSCFALFLACHIPRRIMVNQIYSDLIKEYRSVEMGVSIFSIFHFYVNECNERVDAIAGEYRKKYDKQIKIPLKRGEPINYANTLHFQRRLVAQFYADLARLRYEERLSAKQLREWFTPRELTLLALILHMVKPAEAVFEEAHNVSEPPNMEEGVLMNKWIYKLYEEVEDWEWE